jgi:hypothetical protein
VTHGTALQQRISLYQNIYEEYQNEGISQFSFSCFSSFLSPFSTWRICSREVKNKSWECDWSAKKIAAKKLDQF